MKARKPMTVDPIFSCPSLQTPRTHNSFPLSLVSRTASAADAMDDSMSSRLSAASVSPEKLIADATDATMEAAATGSSSDGGSLAVQPEQKAEVHNKVINTALLAASFGFALYQILNIDHGMTRGWTQSVSYHDVLVH